MPLPAAKPTTWRAAPSAAGAGSVKWPCGGKTCSVSPAFSRVPIQFEKRPPGTRRTPTRSTPSRGAAQIE